MRDIYTTAGVFRLIGAIALFSWTGGVSQAAALPPEVCKYEKAHYVLMGDKGVEAGFVKHVPTEQFPTNVFFFISVASAHKTFWYAPEHGSNFGNTKLISINDPRNKNWAPPDPDGMTGRPAADEEYFAVRANLSFDEAAPDATAQAPAYIFVPDFAPNLWSATRGIGKPISVPRAFLKLTKCG